MHNMRHCLPLKSPPPPPPPPSSSSSSSSTTTTTTASTVLQGNSREDTPRSNSEQLSPNTTTSSSTTINLSREYTLAVQTNSYNEIQSKIQGLNELVSLSQVLRPNRECVEEALSRAMPNTLTNIVSLYFNHSENTSYLCLRLCNSVKRARALYAPLLDLLDTLPLDSQSLAQSHCDCAFDVFLRFDRLDNPFHSLDSHNFHDMRRGFSQLKQQLDHGHRKSRSRRCFFSVACLPRRFTKKELAPIAQLDAAAKGTYVLNNDLNTIDRLVSRLHTAVESDKWLIRLGLERSREKQPIQEVVKQLRKNHPNILNQLQDLEDHICFYFKAVNWARSLLLQEICLHQTHNS